MHSNSDAQCPEINRNRFLAASNQTAVNLYVLLLIFDLLARASTNSDHSSASCTIRRTNDCTLKAKFIWKSQAQRLLRSDMPKYRGNGEMKR